MVVDIAVFGRLPFCIDVEAAGPEHSYARAGVCLFVCVSFFCVHTVKTLR